MPAYLHRAAYRHSDGMLGPTLHQQIIEAPTVEAAIAIARTINLDMAALGANTVFVTTSDDGRAIWSLHTGGRLPEQAPDPGYLTLLIAATALANSDIIAFQKWRRPAIEAVVDRAAPIIRGLAI